MENLPKLSKGKSEIPKDLEYLKVEASRLSNLTRVLPDQILQQMESNKTKQQGDEQRVTEIQYTKPTEPKLEVD